MLIIESLIKISTAQCRLLETKGFALKLVSLGTSDKLGLKFGWLRDQRKCFGQKKCKLRGPDVPNLDTFCIPFRSELIPCIA